MDEITREMRTAEEVVRKVLIDRPLAKDSDKELFIGVMQEAGANLTLYQQNVLRDLFALETYTRARRIIQNEKKTLRASPTVEQYRAKREVAHRQAAIQNWHWELNPLTNSYYKAEGAGSDQQELL